MQTSTFLGMENRVLLTSGETEGAVGVIDILIQPGAGAPLHTNTREALLWFVIDGTLTLQKEEGPVRVGQGSAIYLPKGATQTFANTSDRPVRALLVCMPGGFEGYLLELSGRLPADLPTGPPSPEATELIVRTAERYGSKVHVEEFAVVMNQQAEKQASKE
jgi:mannose-6-phosphate isomerase-like protein (cupin superfamily)